MRLTFALTRFFIVLFLTSLLPAPAVADLTLQGLNGEAEKNVRLMLLLEKEPCDSPEWKIRRLFNESGEQINQGLRALGYYHPVIKKTLTLNDECWQADFTVEAGPRVIVDKVSIDFTGDVASDDKFQKLAEDLRKIQGQPLRHDRYRAMKSRIESLALERGYLKGDFTEKELLIDKERNKAYIKLVFNGGKRMKFGKVSIDQDVLNPEFVSKFVAIKSGDFYSSQQLADSYNALSLSGYFKGVDIRPDNENSHDDIVPVNISLVANKIHHFSFGAGYDTDIGPLLSAGYKNRRLNRRGHYLNANLDLSPVLSTADLEYNIPLANPIYDVFSFGGGLKREDTDSYKSLSAKISARLKHTYASGWKQTLFLDWIYEDFTAGSTSNQVLLLVPGGSWLRSVADSTLRPTRGYRTELNLAGSYQNPVSDVSFAQGSVAAVWMHPLPWKGRFIARTEQGATLVDQFDKLPTTYRFYAGGMNSIRGYAYKELGPKDALGNVAGGKFLSVVSAEYEQAVLDNWGVAAFIDSGNAYNLDHISIKSGVGLGVRWYSPFGLVRLDFAIPLNESDSSFQIHFAAGARL